MAQSVAVSRPTNGIPRDSNAVAMTRTRLDNRMIEMRTVRMSWWVHWREIADYLLPRRYKWLITANQGNRGSPQNQRIVDNTGTIALRVLSSGMMSGITNPGNQWFTLEIDDHEDSNDADVRKWLEDCGKAMLRWMAKSNFYTSVNTIYEDLGAFGTAAMIIYEDAQDLFRCYNPCAGEFYVANSYRFEVDTLYRQFTMTCSQMVQQFGFENCDITVQTLYRSPGSRKDQEFIVCHAIEPNEDFIPGAKGPRGMPFMEYYWQWGSADTQLLSKRPFHECPFMVPRWNVRGNDAYGVGCPGMDALGDLKQLMVQTKRLAQAIDKMVNPPMLADVALKNEPASLLPGGVTYVASTSQVGFKPVYEVNPDVTKIESNMQLCRDRINKTFYSDVFLSITSLDTVRTATDINARKAEQTLQLGPVLERFENEFLDPAVKRVFSIMRRASLASWAVGEDGILPQPPSSIRGKQINVRYVSMLAEAQKAIATSGVERWLAQLGNLAGVDPTVMDNVDVDQVAEGYGEMLGVSERFIRPKKKVDAIRAQRQKQQQQAQQLQQTLPAVKGAQVLSQTDVGGGQNALQKMIANQ